MLIDKISEFARMVKNALAEAELGSGDSGVGSEEAWPLQGEARQRGRFRFVVTEKAAHEQMILDKFFLRKKKGNGGEEIEHWLRSVLSAQRTVSKSDATLPDHDNHFLPSPNP